MKGWKAIPVAILVHVFVVGVCVAFPSIEKVGSPQTVYQYKTQKCDDVDIPDSPLRAYRAEDGTVVAFSTHYVNRRFIGSDLASLHRDCRIVYEGLHSGDPEKFSDRTWISATWTPNGRDIVALGHNEFHGEDFAGRCKFTLHLECWYASIVLLHSSDGGLTFSRVDSKKPRPVISSPLRSDENQGSPRGYSDPSNIFSFGGYFYVLVAQKGVDKSHMGRCLLRTKDPGILDSWTVFDGHDFVPSAGSAYDNSGRHSLCEPVTGLSGALGSVAKIRGSNLFAAFSVDGSSEGAGGAIKVAFSQDLMHWSGQRIVMPVSAFWSKTCSGNARYNYVSVVDDSDSGRNFDTIGAYPWLFVVRAGCAITMDRDLVRIRLHVINK